MKRHITLLITFALILSFSACKKNDIQQFIYAGSSTGDYLTYKAIDPPAEMYFEYPSSGTTFSPDINNDGEDDITFGFSGSASPGHSMFSMKVAPSDDFELCVGTESGLAAQMAEGQIIDENCTWSDEELTMHSYSFSLEGNTSLTGDWLDLGISYIGFRIKNGKVYQYGWIEVNMESGSSWAINSYAFITE